MNDSLYDPAFLNSQYNNRLHVPDFQDYLDRWERLSRETEKALPIFRDIPYGPLPREKLDVFPSSAPGSKTLVFIHGGYWQMLDKSLFYFLAAGFRARGLTTVFLSYPLAPDYGMDRIVTSCRMAMAWLYSNISRFGGDPEQLYVAGHSAGAHLAAMLVATDWARLYPGVPATVLKGACFVSGLFYLEPIRLSYLNAVLQLDSETALRNSPVLLEPLVRCPMVVAVGEAETAAFQEQSKVLYEGWKERGSDIQFLSLPGLNHFSVVEGMAERRSALYEVTGRLIGV